MLGLCYPVAFCFDCLRDGGEYCSQRVYCGVVGAYSIEIGVIVALDSGFELAVSGDELGGAQIGAEECECVVSEIVYAEGCDFCKFDVALMTLIEGVWGEG